MVILALQSAVQHSPDPFFTNDIIGVLKLAGLVGAIVVPIMYGIVKLVFFRTTEDVKALRDDVNGQGKRIDAAKAEQDRTAGQVAGLTNRLSTHEGSVSGMQREIGAVGAAVEASRAQSHELQTDITTLIIEGNRSVQEKITELKIEVARLDERGKFSETLGDIAQALRGISRSHPNSG